LSELFEEGRGRDREKGKKAMPQKKRKQEFPQPKKNYSEKRGSKRGRIVKQ